MIVLFTILISNIIEFILFTYFYKTLLSFKHINIMYSGFIYISLFIVKSICNLLLLPQLNLFVSLFIYFILLLIYSSSKLRYKILTLCLYFGLSIFSESLTFQISTFISLFINQLFIQMIISKVILFIIITILHSFTTFIDEENIDFKNTILLSIQPLSIILFIYISNGKLILESNNKLLIIFSIILLILSNLISFYIFEQIIRKNKLEKELAFEKIRLKENQIYYNSLKENINNFKSYRHDLKHHLSTLKTMIHLNKNEEVLIYIDKLSEKIIEISDIRCGDEFWDLVLSSRLHKINNLKINMIYELRKINLSHISQFDLNTIYSNILDNAIESCAKCDTKVIKIQSMEMNSSYSVVKVTNSCNFVNIHNDKFISTKNDYSNKHGYGLMNIQKTLEKYDSHVSFIYKEDLQTFETTLYFKK